MSSVPLAAAEHRWSTYANVRFGYAICYPADRLKPQREADNSDGRRFTADDGAELIVYGANNALRQSADEIRRDVVKRLGGKVTYRSDKRDRFVVSGIDARGRIFYAALKMRADQYASFELTYPRSLAGLYDAVATRLSTCFHVPR